MSSLVHVMTYRWTCQCGPMFIKITQHHVMLPGENDSKRQNRQLQVWWCWNMTYHYSGMIISAMESQIIGVSIVSLTVCSGADKKRQSSVSLAFVRGIHRSPVNFPHKGPVMQNMFPFVDVNMRHVYRVAIAPSASAYCWQQSGVRDQDECKTYRNSPRL